MEFVATSDPIQDLVSGIQSIQIDKVDQTQSITDQSVSAVLAEQEKKVVVKFVGFNPKGTYYIGKSNLSRVVSTFKAGGVLLYRVNPHTLKFQILVGLEHRGGTKSGVIPLSVHPIGGRRDLDEEPLLTSAREFYEETGELFPLQHIMDMINPIHKDIYALPPIHRPKSFYFTGGKYCLYIARCPVEMETLDDRYNELKSSDLSHTAELTGVTWVDWDFFEKFFETFPPSKSPTRDALYRVEEEDRAQFVQKLLVDEKEIHKQDEVVLSSFMLELFGNSLVYSELCSRRNNLC